MRKFDDLSDQDKGVYIVREEIKKLYDKQNNAYTGYTNYTTRERIILRVFGDCIDLCNDLLDIATLGEIEDV